MYKLTYFDLAGRGEPARLIMAAAGIQFIDNRVKYTDWPTLKANLEWGQLPTLEVGERTLTQSKAIYRYLARKFKMTGADEWEAAKCDELVDAMSDITDEYVQINFMEPDPAKKEEKMKKFLGVTVPAFLGRIEKVQAANGGQWLVGKSMTWADIVIAENLRQLLEKNPSGLDSHPNVKKAHDAVFANEKIKKYRSGN